MEHILVTTDLSEESEVALNEAVNQISLRAGKAIRVSVLTVLEIPLFSADVGEAVAIAPDVENFLTAQQAAARSKLATLSEQYLSPKNIGSETIVEQCVLRTSADVAEAIVEYAREEHASLIIIATHGRTGFRRLLLGSVTDRLLRNSIVPVLVVPIQQS